MTNSDFFFSKIEGPSPQILKYPFKMSQMMNQPSIVEVKHVSCYATSHGG